MFLGERNPPVSCADNPLLQRGLWGDDTSSGASRHLPLKGKAFGGTGCRWFVVCLGERNPPVSCADSPLLQGGLLGRDSGHTQVRPYDSLLSRERQQPPIHIGGWILWCGAGHMAMARLNSVYLPFRWILGRYWESGNRNGAYAAALIMKDMMGA